MVGKGLQREGFSRREHVLAKGHEGEFNRHRALRHDDVVGLDERRVFSFADFNGLCVLEDGPTADEFSASILEKRFNTFVEAVDDAFFPAHEVAHIKFCRARD